MRPDRIGGDPERDGLNDGVDMLVEAVMVAG
jgi:hypothetical protein